MQVSGGEVYFVVNAGNREKDVNHIQKHLKKYQVWAQHCLVLPDAGIEMLQHWLAAATMFAGGLLPSVLTYSPATWLTSPCSLGITQWPACQQKLRPIRQAGKSQAICWKGLRIKFSTSKGVCSQACQLKEFTEQHHQA